ncbi:MAG: hypothetical protein BGN91_15685 [Nitrobacter sp. 62-13]|uniref:hypothetical protein n=1 Tax=Nitrobacter sp. 62-13 TaxID=1895797 RepID=UPI000966400B|nr:hypothetical protein [Nitrobacter sp. 62-13]OJU27446.1 MAG: hypothetical protein BGN91_15685 [Nitrobacter sp. 62-13]
MYRQPWRIPQIALLAQELIRLLPRNPSARNDAVRQRALKVQASIRTAHAVGFRTMKIVLDAVLDRSCLDAMTQGDTTCRKLPTVATFGRAVQQSRTLPRSDPVPSTANDGRGGHSKTAGSYAVHQLH